MADRGAIAVVPTGAALTAAQLQSIYPLLPRVVRCLGLDSFAERLSLDARRDDTEGTASAPSLYLPKGGTLRLRIPIDPGARAITVKVKQPSTTLPRPSARLLPNAAIGLNAELSATAPAGTGWVSIGPLAFTATAKGGVMVELIAPWSGGESGTWFDALTLA